MTKSNCVTYSTDTVTFLVVICIWRTVIRLQQGINIIRQLHAASGPRFTRQSQRNSFNVTCHPDSSTWAIKRLRQQNAFSPIKNIDFSRLSCESKLVQLQPGRIHLRSSRKNWHFKRSSGTNLRCNVRECTEADSICLGFTTADPAERVATLPFSKNRRVWGFVGPLYRVPVECLVYY